MTSQSTPSWPSLYDPGLEFLHLEHHGPTQPGGAYLSEAIDIFRFTLYWTLIFYTPIFFICGAYAFWNINFPPSYASTSSSIPLSPLNNQPSPPDTVNSASSEAVAAATGGTSTGYQPWTTTSSNYLIPPSPNHTSSSQASPPARVRTRNSAFPFVRSRSRAPITLTHIFNPTNNANKGYTYFPSHRSSTRYPDTTARRMGATTSIHAASPLSPAPATATTMVFNLHARRPFTQPGKMPKTKERRSRLAFALLVFLAFLALSVAGAVIGATVVGFTVMGLYKAAGFHMSTWIPFLLALIQVVIGLLRYSAN